MSNTWDRKHTTDRQVRFHWFSMCFEDFPWPSSTKIRGGFGQRYALQATCPPWGDKAASGTACPALGTKPPRAQPQRPRSSCHRCPKALLWVYKFSKHFNDLHCVHWILTIHWNSLLYNDSNGLHWCSTDCWMSVFFIMLNSFLCSSMIFNNIHWFLLMFSRISSFSTWCSPMLIGFSWYQFKIVFEWISLIRQGISLIDWGFHWAPL